MPGTRAGALIQAARVKAGLTQAALAERSATSQPAVSAYEHGRKVPDLATLERLLAAAGFDLRMSLAPLDDHDESLARYEEQLSTTAARAFRERQRARL